MLANINASVKKWCYERHQATLDDLHVLMQRFAGVITDMNALESEFLKYQATPDDEFPTYFVDDDKPMPIDHIWYQTFKQIDLYSGQPCFKHFVEFDFHLILIPHSNSYCESIFSTIRKICTDGLHNLGKDATQDHTATSLYTETTSIRKNLLGILIPKVNIFGKKKLACYEWEPTNTILTGANSATYKNLQARKKQRQQQVAANGNPEDWTFIIIFVNILT